MNRRGTKYFVSQGDICMGSMGEEGPSDDEEEEEAC